MNRSIKGTSRSSLCAGEGECCWKFVNTLNGWVTISPVSACTEIILSLITLYFAINLIKGCDSYPAGRFEFGLFACNSNKKRRQVKFVPCAHHALCQIRVPLNLSVSRYWVQMKQNYLKEWPQQIGASEVKAVSVGLFFTNFCQFTLYTVPKGSANSTGGRHTARVILGDCLCRVTSTWLTGTRFSQQSFVAMWSVLFTSAAMVLMLWLIGVSMFNFLKKPTKLFETQACPTPRFNLMMWTSSPEFWLMPSVNQEKSNKQIAHFTHFLPFF